MTLTEQVAADAQAVIHAQATLDAAKAKAQASQSALDALAPHLSWIQDMEAAAARYGEEAKAEISSILARAKALLNI